MADEDENVEADPCTVCGDSGDYANDRFIFCDGCDVGFHQSCYGLQEQTFTDSDSEDFYCHYCSQINHNTSPSTKSSTFTKCELCAMDRGDLAILAVDGDDSMKQFVHVICAYAFKCNQSENGTKVKVNSVQLQDDGDHKSSKCMLCTVANGFKIGCAHPECTQQVHPSCARIQCNGGNDSFYFDDIYDDRLFRNPMYFCPLHAVQLPTMDPSKRKLRAIKLIKLWNKQKSKRNQRGTKKRKRASKQENADYSDWTPTRKRRKIMNPMESSDDKQTQKTVRNVKDREDERLCTDAMPMEEQGVLHRETTTNNMEEAEEEMDENQSSLSSSFEALSCDATSTLKESNQDIAQNGESTEDDDVDIKHEDTINDDAFTVMDIHKHPTRSSKHSKSVDIYAALRELNKVREQRREDSEEAEGSNQQKKRKKTKNMANIHDFAYCLDKCCCSLCLQPLNGDHDHDAKQESPWFDGALWFNAEYKMKPFGSEEKSKLTASFCRNLRIQMDHSPTFHNDSDRDGNTSQRTTKHEMEPCTVEPFESMAMYNCSAFVDSKGQHQDIAIPQCPLNKEGNSKSTLFYHETYRDIVINGNGAVQCLDICPLNRYHTKNPFNYLAVFADNHQKYHSVAEEQDPEDEREYLIQIWKIRKSQSFAKKAKKQCQGIQSLDTNQWVIAAEKHKNALFHYGIVHRGGFIWDMKWLPMRIEHKPPESMRTQNGKYQRMGLMAVCGADKMLYIYSMPFIVADEMLLEIQPVVQLSIWNETFTRLSWPCHVTSPLLLAATVNGSVAMWNMEQLSTSELERDEMNAAMYSVEDQQMELVACYDGNDRIVAMDWCSDQEGHFITVSESGCLKLWDLNNLFTPLFTRDLYSSPADLQWIPGLDCAVVTGESYGSAGSNTSTKGKSRSSGSCSKLVSLWPLAGKSTSRKMGQVVQFPGEKLYAVLNQVARSVDILIAAKCTRHSMSKLVDHTDGVTVYVVVGMSSGSVRFYHQEMAQLVDMKALANGQIMSQLIFDGKSHIEGTNETEADGVECSIRGPFYGITGPVNKKQCDVTRQVWTEEKNDKPVYDPYHVSPTHMALDDSAPIRKVRLCPNEEHLDIVSGSISGIIRIQTVQR